MLSPPLSQSTNDHHPRRKRRTSTPHATQAKDCDNMRSKPRPRSGSWAGSASESHQFTVNFSPPQSPKVPFLSHFTKQHSPATSSRYHVSDTKLSSRDEAGFVYNPSKRTSDSNKRKKGPLSGIGNFFRRLRQNNDPIHPKEILVNHHKSSSPPHSPKKILPNAEEKQDLGIRTHLLHSEPLDTVESDPSPPRERSKRESLQAHLRYFGLELNSLLPSESLTSPTQLQSSHSSSELDEYRQKLNGSGARQNLLCSSPSKTCSCIREEPEIEADGHSSVSLSRGSCYTCESIYNTYTTYRRSESSVTEIAAQDNGQGRQHGAAESTSQFNLQQDHHSDNDDDDVFIDAESTTRNESAVEGRADQLTKRLSGGHFGSAGDW
ncbi:hypothetical protein BGW37DRAFT_522112 [Umbelopsis sp. PMI_123]|nr:hypothetical protein BGW37DRAFT_522112 [Umbelopsis sp. PMI_123]